MNRGETQTLLALSPLFFLSAPNAIPGRDNSPSAPLRRPLARPDDKADLLNRAINRVRLFTNFVERLKGEDQVLALQLEFIEPIFPHQFRLGLKLLDEGFRGTFQGNGAIRQGGEDYRPLADSQCPGKWPRSWQVGVSHPQCKSSPRPVSSGQVCRRLGNSR